MNVQLSPDGKYYWDGTQWVALPTPAPAKPSNAWKVWLLILGGLALIAYFGSQAHSHPTISNARILSAYSIEFDYYAASDCSDLTFEYAFFDGSGNRVGDFVGVNHNVVRKDQSYHFTVTSGSDPINGDAARFDVYASCHS